MIIRIGKRTIKPTFLVKKAIPTQKIGRKKKIYYVLALKGELEIGEKTKGDVMFYSSTLGPFFLFKTPTSYKFSSRSPINNLLRLANVSHYKYLTGCKFPIITDGSGWLIDLEE